MGFWKPKFAETIKRDKRNLEVLLKLGWRVAVVWECAVKEVGAEAVATRLAKWLQSKSRFRELSSAAARQTAQRQPNSPTPTPPF
jgi:DNA mismatch endonuclease (patch repair protein)